MVFNRNGFPKMTDFSRLGDLQACSHVHRISELSMGWVDPWVGLGWVGSTIAKVLKI